MEVDTPGVLLVSGAHFGMLGEGTIFNIAKRTMNFGQ